MAGHHAGAVQQHAVVQQGAFAFLHGVQFSGDLRKLLQEKLIHLQPVVIIGVREQVVDHVVHLQVWEPQGGVIVVELQRADSGGVGAERQHEHVALEPHVLVDVLRNAICRAWIQGLFATFSASSESSSSGTIGGIYPGNSAG